MREHAAERVGDADVVLEYLQARVYESRQLAALLHDHAELALPGIEPLERLLDGIERPALVLPVVDPEDVAVFRLEAERRRFAQAYERKGEMGVAHSLAPDLLL
ncbi:MAG: hypothetical protein V8S24_04195 [Gordonibacter pamelaeae]